MSKIFEWREFKIDHRDLRDNCNRFRGIGMLVEYHRDWGKPAIFSIGDTTHVDDAGIKYPSLKEIYLAYKDPTEYLFARDALGGMSNWERLVKNKMLENDISRWREELQMLLKAEALLAIVEQANTKGGFAAAKWLFEKGYKIDSVAGASIDQKKKKTKAEEQESLEVAKRLGISVVNGSK